MVYFIKGDIREVLRCQIREKVNQVLQKIVKAKKIKKKTKKEKIIKNKI